MTLKDSNTVFMFSNKQKLSSPLHLFFHFSPFPPSSVPFSSHFLSSSPFLVFSIVFGLPLSNLTPCSFLNHFLAFHFTFQPFRIIVCPLMCPPHPFNSCFHLSLGPPPVSTFLLSSFLSTFSPSFPSAEAAQRLITPVNTTFHY